MEASTLIRKVHMDCPLCDKTHEVEERKRFATITLKGDKVTYEERFYFCANADDEENEFETGSMTNENLLNARNAYRVKHGLLTSDEIVAIRENYGLSQVDLARLLGWGEATISRYESKAIQDEAYDTMLHYHLIMCIKYRNKVIDDKISIRLKEIFEKIAPSYNITLEEWNHDIDHVHVLFRGQPNTEISKFVNAYKSASSRLIKKEFPQIRNSLWKEMFWSQSFCLLTTGGVTVDIIKQYIQSQGKKDGK